MFCACFSAISSSKLRPFCVVAVYAVELLIIMMGEKFASMLLLVAAVIGTSYSQECELPTARVSDQ